jgi:hypothetical protein
MALNAPAHVFFDNLIDAVMVAIQTGALFCRPTGP